MIARRRSHMQAPSQPRTESSDITSAFALSHHLPTTSQPTKPHPQQHSSTPSNDVSTEHRTLPPPPLPRRLRSKLPSPPNTHPAPPPPLSPLSYAAFRPTIPNPSTHPPTPSCAKPRISIRHRTRPQRQEPRERRLRRAQLRAYTGLRSCESRR